MKKHIYLSLILAGFGCFTVSAQQFAPVGTAVAQFLEIGVGARATAMGEAYTAITDDAGSVFWNPAGLSDIEHREVYLAYTSWPAEIAIGGLAFGWNLEDIGTVAISAVYLSTDDMLVTTEFDPEGTSGQMFNITNYALGLSYSRYMTERLSVGITGKLVREDYFGYGYTAWALDLGTIYHTGFNGLNLAMSILNFGPEINFDGTYIDYSNPRSYGTGTEIEFDNYSLPVLFRIGISIDVIADAQNKLLAAVDMVHPNNNLEQYNIGLEYGFQQMFFLRGGYKLQIDEGGLTLGLGVKYPVNQDMAVQLDYSYNDFGVLSDIHRISFGFGF